MIFAEMFFVLYYMLITITFLKPPN